MHTAVLSQRLLSMIDCTLNIVHICFFHFFVNVLFFRFHFFNNSLYIGCTFQRRYFYSYVILSYFSERGCLVTVALQSMYFRHVFGGS